MIEIYTEFTYIYKISIIIYVARAISEGECAPARN